MKRTVLLRLVLTVTMVLGVTGVATVPASAHHGSGDVVAYNQFEKRLRVATYSQERTQWCWVTGAQGLISWWTHRIPSQCDIYKKGKRAWRCTNNPGSDQDIMRALNGYGVGATFKNGQLTFEDVVRQIDAKRPILAIQKWNNSSSAHVFIITGYDKRTRGLHFVYIPDGKTGVAYHTATGRAYSYSKFRSSTTGTYFYRGGGSSVWIAPHTWVKTFHTTRRL